MIREKQKAASADRNRLSYVIIKHEDEEGAAGLRFASEAAENPVVRCIAAAAAAFVLTGSELGGAHSPLCVPFAAVLSAGGSASALMGIILSCIFRRNIGENLVELSAAAVMTLIKFVSGYNFQSRGCVLLSSISYLICGGIVCFMGGTSLMGAAAVLFRTCICAAAAYIFARAHSSPVPMRNITDPVPLVICWIIAVSALCGIGGEYINPGRIAACAAAAAFAKKHGCTGGAAAGTAAAFGMILADGSFGRSAVLAACAGFASGLASCRGKLAVSLTYIFSSLMLAVTVGLPSGMPGFIVDSAAAGMVYFLIPEKLYTPFCDRIDRRERGNSRHTAARLGFAADIVDEIRRNIGEARQILAGKENGYDASSSVCAEICGKCVRAESCRLAESGALRSCFVYAEKIYSSSAGTYEGRFPKSLEYCCRKAEMIRRFRAELSADGRRKNSVRTADSLSAAAAEQLSAQSLMMRSVSDSFGMKTDGRISVIAEDALKAVGMQIRSAAVYCGRSGRIFCEAFVSGEFSGDLSVTCSCLGEITGRVMDLPNVYSSDNITRYRWSEMPEFIVDHAVRSASGTEEISGDSSDIFSDGFGRLYFIISDGMGSGLRAAEESCMAVSVVSRFIRSGAGTESAVRYANTLLAGIAADEMFTTLDIAELDVFTGKCRFFKLGAAESYIRTGGAVMIKENSSLPVGFLPDISFSAETVRLAAGDCAVMVSDGVGADQRDFISSLVMNDVITSDICADKIISHSQAEENLHSDDRTVIVFKLYDY